MRVSSGIQGELDLINQVFSDESTSEERVLEAAAALYKSGEKNIYARLLHVMCHLRLAPAEAKKTWEAIIRHRDTMESKLGRPTGFRVAMLDYFINESRELKNPKVIEIHVYAETARQAAVDELTGIFNRRFFDAAIEREVKQAARRNRELSLLIIDIDNFKRINDTHGHTTGDAVISALGKLLKKQIRSEDTPCRIGGEEFAVLLARDRRRRRRDCGRKDQA
jgi:two-component system cell cycle response regulator